MERNFYGNVHLDFLWMHAWSSFSFFNFCIFYHQLSPKVPLLATDLMLQYVNFRKKPCIEICKLCKMHLKAKTLINHNLVIWMPNARTSRRKLACVHFSNIIIQLVLIMPEIWIILRCVIAGKKRFKKKWKITIPT